MTEINGTAKIKLTWAQVAWWIATITIVVLSYADIRAAVGRLEFSVAGVYSKTEVDRMKLESDREYSEIKREIQQLDRELTRIKRRLGVED